MSGGSGPASRAMVSAPHTPHVERHFTGGEVVRDIVIGMSDGLTVPFALAAGLSGAVGSTRVIITAGLAEIAAGAIAMGLGGYLAGRSDVEHYASEEAREAREIVEMPAAERAEISGIFREYGVSAEESRPVVEALARKPSAWRDFMMRFELGLERPNPKRSLQSALTIGTSYIAGGIIPLAPYFFAGTAHAALVVSVIVTLAALLVFGYVKGRFTGAPAVRSALQTALIGGLAALAAFAIARAIS